MIFSIYLIFALVPYALPINESHRFSNTWLLQGQVTEEEVRKVSSRLGFDFLQKLPTSHFVLRRGDVPHRSSRRYSYNSSLRKALNLTFIKQEQWINVSLRQIMDPKWPQMWYLNGKSGPSMSVENTWRKNITGRGVRLAIVDDGVDYNHPDLKNRINLSGSRDVYDNDNNPLPGIGQSHGTKCAGVAVAESNNICVIGAAYQATLFALRMIGPNGVLPSGQVIALTTDVDVSSNSWGGTDGSFEGPSQPVKEAFVHGTSSLRGGKGVIYVFAGGNGGFDDNCNMDGYVNSIYTIGINGVARDLEPPGYAEPCSAVMASAYTGKGGSSDNLCTTDVNGGCINSFTGTSAAAPLAAGALALVLEANQKLHWRDMQQLLIETAKLDNLKYTEAQQNAVGRNVSHWFGYGLIDVEAMVQRAPTWQSLPEQHSCHTQVKYEMKTVKPKDTVRVVQSQIYTDGCNDTTYCVNRVEHVEAYIEFSYTTRGVIELSLESPSGTVSTLLTTRGSDSMQNSEQKWTYMSVHHWSENPFGTWKLNLSVKANINEGATLSSWKLILYGTGV
ncbi:furin-like isoform X1 [Mya arenaria]|uniref:furin-like isoform X1 n=1 Tax=Mya arenaria TaxID=6604 RepID=UPI0022E4C5DC|nr:furin-like isoform X1 [Mya arenaria]